MYYFLFQTSREEGVGRGEEVLEQVLRGPGPYPSVVLPPAGGYWLEEPSSLKTPLQEFNTDDTPKCYRTHFFGRVSTA
jgi:hypothetical protein